MVVAVLLGSVRSERMGDRAAKWVAAELEKRGHRVVLVDAAVLKLPILPTMWKEIKKDTPAKYKKLHEKLAPLAKLYARVDGFCVVSAEYNHSIPPGAKQPDRLFSGRVLLQAVGDCLLLLDPVRWRAGGCTVESFADGGGDADDTFASTDSIHRECAEQGWCGFDAGAGGEEWKVSSTSSIGTCVR